MYRFVCLLLVVVALPPDAHAHPVRRAEIQLDIRGHMVQRPMPLDELTLTKREIALEHGHDSSAMEMPTVSVITVGHPMRRTFKFNVLANFLKQDYAGPLELVFVDAGTFNRVLFGERFAEKLVEEGTRVPDITRGISEILTANPQSSLQSFGPRTIVHVNASGRLGANRNAGIQVASGSIIAGLDDDDVYDFSYVSQIVETLSKHPDAMLAYPTKGLFHHFGIDGSVKVEGAKLDGAMAGSHAFRKEVWSRCPYDAERQSNEEMGLIHCTKLQWPGENTRVPISKRPSNGVGYIKLWWSGGTCARVWKSVGDKAQDEKASVNGYWTYTQKVLRTLHYLQEMNGGANVLALLRESFPNLTFPHIPPEDIQSEHGVPTTATCKQWDVLVERGSESLADGLKSSRSIHVDIDVNAASEPV